MLFRSLLCIALFSVPALADPGRRFCTAETWGPAHCIRQNHLNFDTCQLLGAVAIRHGISPGFFARLIWQESRFDFNAVSPAGARGIAQFMPGTARLRALRDSFDPALALDHSAQYLGELTRRYGNPGLAAIAYNGGEGRADGFISKTGGLAQETINYVRIITGLEPEDWRDDPPQSRDFALQPGQPFLTSCLTLARTRRVTPYPEPKQHFAPWGVQIASADSAQTARKRFAIRTRACKAAVGNKPPQIIRKKPQVKGRKTYFVARIGSPNRAAANKLCAKLRQQACACAVYKN